MSSDGGSVPRRAAARLAALRADDRDRTLVVLGGLLVGLGLGSIHWSGLVLGGVLVALPARSIARGLASGVGLGVLGLLVFGVQLAFQGALEPALSAGTVLAVGAGVSVGAPFLGALTRAVV